MMNKLIDLFGKTHSYEKIKIKQLDTTRYRVKQNQTDYYNKTYTLEEYVIKGGTNGADGEVIQSGRVKIKEEDILNLIQFCLEQRILVEKKKEGKQLYNYLKMEDKHQPNKKT